MDCPVTARPTVIVISDSLGDTACEVVLAASGQFDEGAFRLLRLPKVTSVEQVKSFVGPRVDADHRDVAVFHTIVDPALRARVLDYLGMLHIRSVDLIGPTLAVLSSLIGVPPKCVAGVIHKTDDRYFHRIEAMEYFVEHDDGRGCDDLSGADIVLLGVSRTSKTPLSMYLAYQGYKVANVPLAHGMEPPKSIYEVDPMRLFGLISTVDVISEIRDSRLGDDYARAVAGSYAEPESVRSELAEARALMKRLGCFVVRTDGKAIEVSKASFSDFMIYYDVTLMNPKVLAGMFLGSMMAFMFCGLTMNAVGRAAGHMVEEVRRQFREIPGILTGKAEPDYARCVAISTKGAQHEMVTPSLLAIIAPILTGLIFGVTGVVGLLIGGLSTGFVLAIFMANSGGAWDNAKKHIEEGNHGGKGSEAHKATVVGDTVGDPFKDTSGPSLNILIKLMSMVAIVMAGLTVAWSLF